MKGRMWLLMKLELIHAAAPNLKVLFLGFGDVGTFEVKRFEIA